MCIYLFIYTCISCYVRKRASMCAYQSSNIEAVLLVGCDLTQEKRGHVW